MSLPVQLHRDVVLINQHLSLKNTKDLKHLHTLAQNKDTWKALTAMVVKAAEIKEAQRYEAQQRHRGRTRITTKINTVPDTSGRGTTKTSTFKQGS